MGFTAIELSAGAVMCIVALLSVYCSAMLLNIIYQFPKWNGYLVLIFSMTVCELFYDLTFFLLIGYQDHNVFQASSFLFTFGGLAVTFWSNVVSGVLLFLVTRYTPLDIWKHYWKFWLLCVVPSLIYATFDAIYCDHAYMAEAYNILRFTSIVFNFIVYIGITYKLYSIGESKASKGTRAVGPLRELASRYKYYPIVQVICRIPTTVYQIVYGFNIANFHNVEIHETGRVVALFFYALTAPLAGVAYFLVFLYMQPQASMEYRRIIRESCHMLPSWLCGCLTGDYDSVSGDDSSGRYRDKVNEASGCSSNFVGGETKYSSGIRKTQGTRFGDENIPSDDILNPLPLNRSFTDNEIEVGGIFLRGEDCWKYYHDMDEDELDATIRSDETIQLS